VRGGFADRVVRIEPGPSPVVAPAPSFAA